MALEDSSLQSLRAARRRIFGTLPFKQARIDPLQRLREALVQRYAFERELGRGGSVAAVHVSGTSILVGKPEQALDHLEPLHPRFRRLVEGTS